VVIGSQGLIMKNPKYNTVQKLLIFFLVIIFALTPIVIVLKIDYLLKTLLGMFLIWCIIGIIAQP
jgi:hypothetical protein